MYKYKISVVIAVYNVEAYLREAVDSLLNQTIGFENIQLIFIDDGSKDNSGKICDEYKTEYPDNVIVIHKKNEGLSKARADGIQHVEGKYTSFFDPDDILTADTFEKVFKFFEAHYEEVDLVSMPIYFFGEKSGAHPLNKKFSQGSRVIDLQKEFNCVQLSFATSLVKKEVLYLIGSDSEIVTAEDAKEIFKILLLKEKIGVVADAKYMYRKRSTSTLGGAKGKKGWYDTYLSHFPDYAFEYCRNKVGSIPKFVQYTVMYDLQWKIRQAHIPSNILTEEEATQYRAHLLSILQNIDDDIIWAQQSLNIEQKIFLAESKHSDILPKVIFDKETNTYAYYINESITYGFQNFQLQLNFCKVLPDHIEIEGAYLLPTKAFGMPQFYAVANSNRFAAADNHYDEIIYSIDMPIALRKGFKISVPIHENLTNIEFMLQYGSFAVRLENIVFGKHFPLTKRLENTHYYQNGNMLLRADNSINVQKMGAKSARKIEAKYLWEIFKRKDKPAKRAVICRLLVHILQPLTHKDIWLITDKADRADDNGEAFFLYCMQHKKEANCYPIFAVSKKSHDYARMRQYGPVIPYMSWRHKLCHLLAKHTISAYSHDEITSPFLKYSYYYSDILQSNRIIFLQHGITKDDVSAGLNRNHKNFSLFVTSTVPEYKSILAYNYGYTEKQVILTGLPRYDRLYNNCLNKITIMPTWRRSLFGKYNHNTSQWSLLPGFENSDFYQFYSNLLNSQKLHSAAEKSGYTLQLLIHPTLFPYLSYFNIDPRVKVLKSDAVYRDIFAESALILTDYSSVAFDMAYLRKPVVYAHFDSNHYAEGYFDYERDGFGEVEYNLEDTVDRIIEYMENGCQLKAVYRMRIDNFFAFNDKNSCQRVFEKIQELDKS